MKFFKGFIIIVSLLAFTSVTAQDSKEKAENKVKWMDKDQNNSISLEEMLAFYKDKKDKKGRPIKAKDIFIGQDHNNDGKVTAEELQKKINWKKVNTLKNKKTKETAQKGNKKVKLPEDKTERRLYWMDADKNKTVSLEEMQAFFKGKKDKKGRPMNAENIFLGTDANDDGKVTLEELKKGVNWKKVNAKNKNK